MSKIVRNILAIGGGAALAAGIALAAAESLAVDQTKQRGDSQMSKEWSFNHPKAKDPNAFPSPDETSLDLEKLRTAKSLREIYDLANEMNPGSISDNRVLSKAVSEYMQACCKDYDSAIGAIRAADFKIVQDITQSAQNMPEAYGMAGVDFDMVVFSEQTESIRIFSAPPRRIEYKIYLFFKDNHLVEVSARIFDHELF